MAAGDDSSVNLASPTGLTDTRLNAAGEQRQVVILGNAGDRVVGVEPRNALNVNLGPNTLFVDQWSGALDTTDRWTVVSGATPTFSAGQMVMPATVSTFNVLKSKPMMPYTLGYQYLAMGIQLETTAATGAGRFWGVGNQATTPAPGVLVQDGIGFEIDQAAGSLLAVTYAAGVRTTVATLTRPADGALHRYAMHFRVTDASWYIDGLDIPVATASFPNVQVQELPVLIVRQNAASFTGTPTFSNIAVALGDTSRMGDQIIDGTFPWRKATVKGGSTAPVAADTALVVGLHPSAPLPAGTSTIGAVNVNGTVPVSLATNTPDVTDRAARLLGVLSTGANTIGAVNIAASQTVGVTQATAGNLNATAVLAAGTNAIGHLNEQRASTLCVTTTAAVTTAITLTLPAAAAGLFHYITALDLVLYSSAARTGAAAPVLVTTTNLPGSPVFTFSTAGAIGTTDVQKLAPATPVKSSVAATATTIVAPAATGGIWRLTATYFTAA